MDTLNKRDFPGSDSPELLGAHSIIVGAKQLKKALLRGGVLRVYLALDADPGVTGPLEALCGQTGTEFHWVEKMSDLGRACGIDVGAAAAAVAAD